MLFSSDTTMAVVHMHVRENRRDNTETQSILNTRIYSRSYVIKHLALKVVRGTVLLQYDAFPVAFEITNRTPLTYKCRCNVENVHHVYIAASCTCYQGNTIKLMLIVRANSQKYICHLSLFRFQVKLFLPEKVKL